MKKNVYSLVLSEDVVRAVDALAYREGSNRSALINRILAEYVSYTTPEMRVKEVFSELGALLSATSLLIGEPTQTVLPMRSSLSYKYNPTVRYSVELYKEGDALGALRVSLRTQNAALLSVMRAFYTAFTDVEEELIGEPQVYIEDDKYMRVLRLRKNTAALEGMHSASDIAGVISEYVSAFDSALKAYFATNSAEEAHAVIRRIYRTYLRDSKEII